MEIVKNKEAEKLIKVLPQNSFKIALNLNCLNGTEFLTAITFDAGFGFYFCLLVCDFYG